MRSMRMAYFHGEVFRQGGHRHGRMRLVDLAQNDGDRLRAFIFQKISKDLFVHIIKLAPHRATRGTTDFLHDVADLILAEDLRQHRLGTFHQVKKPADRGNLLGKLDEQSLDRVRFDIAEAGPWEISLISTSSRWESSLAA